MQYKVLSGPKDKYSGTAVTIDLGKEPDPKLFEPENYEELKPSEVDRRMLVAIGHGEHLADPEHVSAAKESDAMHDSRHEQK
jgi:hypothetical protein